MDEKQISSSYLKAVAASWLRYERGYQMVVFERGPFIDCEKPDVLAVSDRYTTTEIECKISMADFKNNFKKRHMQRRKALEREGVGIGYGHPAIFYFLVLPSMVDRVLASGLLTTEGLLTLGTRRHFYTNLLPIVCVKKPKSDRKAPKITLRQMRLLVKDQTGTLVALAVKNEHLKANTAPPGNMLQS